MQLSVALQGIVTQQLLPTADGRERTVATEVLVPSPAVRNLIREGKTHQIYSALQTGGAHGMQTMDASLAPLVRERKITRELAEARSSTPQELRRLMGTVQAGVGVPQGRWRRSRSRPSTSPGSPRTASSTPATSRRWRRSCAARAGRPRHRGAQARERGRHPRSLPEGQGARSDRLDAPVLGDGQLGHFAPALDLRAREQTESDKLKEALTVVRADIEAGISLADTLAKHPDIFNELYVAMVAAGETGGILEDTLRRVADQLEKDDALRRQARGDDVPGLRRWVRRRWLRP